MIPISSAAVADLELHFPRWTTVGHVSIVDELDDNHVLLEDHPARGRVRTPAGRVFLKVTEGIDASRATQYLSNGTLDLLLVRYLHDPRACFLDRFESLQRVALINNATDACIPAVLRQSRLSWLQLSGPGLTDVGCAALKGMTSLEHVVLSSASITGAALLELVHTLTQLVSIHLEGSELDEDFARQLCAVAPPYLREWKVLNWSRADPVLLAESR